MKLFVLVPCLNEEMTVADVVRRVPKKIDGIDSVSTIVLDDGSTDDTAKNARLAGADVVSNGVNRGLGFTFSHGIKTALQRGGDIIVNLDGDGQFSPEDIPQLLQPILDDKADFVTASRFKDKALVPDMPRLKRWGNAWMSRMVSVMVKQRFHDVSCGFRAYSREAALQLNLWGKFTYTQETFLDLAVKDVRIAEVPVKVIGTRPVGTSRMASNLWKYAIRTAVILFRSYRDYWPLHFFGWISVPFFVAGLSLGTFFLGHYLRTGRFSPHLWAGFSGGALVTAGCGFLFLGFVADMFKRIRLNQERLIFQNRFKEFAEPVAERLE